MSNPTVRPDAAARGPLLALAAGGFGIGLTEFVVAGVLPDVAADLAIGPRAAAWIISGYALSVAVGAFAVTLATARLTRKRVLLLLLGAFVVGNAICAAAPTYGWLIFGRVVAALCHGAFFGTGAVVAAALVPPDRRARAIGLLFTGLTVANVVGVPAGTFVAEQFGWRSTFVSITAIGLLALAGVARLIPADAGGVERLNLRAEARALRARQVWVSLVVTALGFGGMFGAFSLISYPLQQLAGYASSDLPWLLTLFGVGLVAGNAVGARAADRRRDPAILAALLALALVMALFAATASSPVAAAILLPLMGMLGFAIAPGVQARVLDAAAGAETLASSANIAAFNVGNALAAWIGAAALAWTAAGALISGAALVLLAAAIFAAAHSDQPAIRGTRAKTS